jgi:tetrahydromethanopterin S-methyltransferase subunit E
MQTRTMMSSRTYDRRLLTNGLTLLALGLSILFLNSWDNLVVRTTVGLFWGAFILILNGPAAIKLIRGLNKKNDTNRRNPELSIERR